MSFFCEIHVFRVSVTFLICLNNTITCDAVKVELSYMYEYTISFFYKKMTEPILMKLLLKLYNDVV